MPGNHCTPHTPEARAKMSAALRGLPRFGKRRPSMVVDGITLWRCGRCHWFLRAERFHRNKRTVLGLTSECRSCHNATSIRTRGVAQRLSRLASEVNRRSRKASAGRITAAELREIRTMLGARCCQCRSAEDLHFDHVVPLAAGGAHHPTNIQLLCRRYNERKQARTEDYRTSDQLEALHARWPVTAANKKAA
jgi:5-methylcytosine-specific restriction endonuclease McrA